MNPKIKRFILSIVLILAIGGLGREIFLSMPSNKITIYSGPVGGTYYQMARTYQNELAALGYEVTINPADSTAKLLENVNNSRNPNTIGFMIGRTDADQYPDIRSLGFVGVQPLFLFYSSAFGELISLSTLKGRAILMPPKASVTTQKALALLSLYNITPENTRIKFLPFRQAVEDLKKGDAYALFLMLGAEHPEIDRLMMDPNLSAFSYSDITGILNKLDDMTRVSIPAGSYDVLRQVPAKPIDLLSSQVEIIANENLDKPAAYALLNTFTNIHDSASLTHSFGAYPSFVGLLARPHLVTSTFGATGTPWLYRTLPSKLAVLIDKYLIIGLAVFLLAEIYRVLHYFYEFLVFSAETLALNILKRKHQRQKSGKRIGLLGRLAARWAESVVKRKSTRQKAAEILNE